MHIIEWIQTRPSTDVKWFSHVKIEKLNHLRNEFPGFLGKSVTLAEDKLSRIVIIMWNNIVSSEEFFTAHAELIEECNILTSVYNHENRITLDRSARIT